MTKFFSRLSYSFGNEDWRSETRALSLQPNDHVLCITASGDRPLNLLTRPCQKMTCVDANPMQNHLLHLKIAAMTSLNYPDYLAFLGLQASDNRYKTLQKFSSKLSSEDAKFWLNQQKMINKGVIYQGAVERLTKIGAKGLRIFRGKKIERLLAMKDISEQQQFIKNEWNTYLWRKLFEVALNPLVSRCLIEDPGLNTTSEAINPGKYIFERLHKGLEREFVHNSVLISLILKGTVSSEAFPPYLTPAAIPKIKSHLATIESKTMDIVEYLESISEPTFDAFSLSDVASYLSSSKFERLLKGIVRTAKPGARFCLRQFLSTYTIPDHLKPFFVRNSTLENELEQSDNCFVYRFLVGTIDK